MKQKRLLLILLAILFIGGVGYTGWKTWGDKTPPQQQKNQTADPSEGGKYLVIKEWGVRFPTTENTQDLIYSFVPEGSNNIHFGLVSLANKYSSCAPEEIGLSLGVTRSKDSNFTISQPISKIGEYYYAAAGGGVSCVAQEAPSEDKELLGLARVELSRAFNSIQDIK